MNTILNKSISLLISVKDIRIGWPAQIENIDNKTLKKVIKYQYKFFATNETSVVNKYDIWPLNENKN